MNLILDELFTNSRHVVLDVYLKHFFSFFSALSMLLKAAKRQKIEKLMIYASLPYVRQNMDKLSKWIEKKWSHGTNGKGKPITNRDKWKKINCYLEAMEVNWVWDPKGQTFKSVMEKAAAMALLVEG